MNAKPTNMEMRVAAAICGCETAAYDDGTPCCDVKVAQAQRAIAASGTLELLAALERMLAAHDADVATGSLIAAGNGQAAEQARTAIAKAKGAA